MFIEEVNQLLDSRYLKTETGYYRLPDDQIHIAVLTRMPGCKARWVDWWFKTFIVSHDDQTSSKKALWPMQLSIKKSVLAFEAKHKGKYVMDREIANIKLELAEPTKYFDISRFKTNGMRVVICGDNFFPDGSMAGHIIYIVRNTAYGCEMRSHFWINNCPEDRARARMEHCIEDMGDLADFLRVLIQKIKQHANIPDISCKFCYSDEVVKNGIRKSGQYWLCKSCGHHFINNNALPNMRYPTETITKAVDDYISGHSLSSICSDIMKQLDISPSQSAIYAWKKKLTKMAKTK